MSSTACGISSTIAANDSRTPAGLPGRFTTSADPAAPTTARDSAAIGVCCSPAARITSASPGASRSITARVASGVTSRGPNPVPPVVTTRPWSAASVRSAASICGCSSGTTVRVAISKPADRSIRSAASPEASSRVPAATPSLTVTTAALPPMRPILPLREGA
jgi:hypothetical protein